MVSSSEATPGVPVRIVVDLNDELRWVYKGLQFPRTKISSPEHLAPSAQVSSFSCLSVLFVFEPPDHSSQLHTMAAHQEHNEKAASDAQHGPAIEVEKPSDKHEEYVVDTEGKPVRIDYSGAHKKTDPEEIRYNISGCSISACPLLGLD